MLFALGFLFSCLQWVVLLELFFLILGLDVALHDTYYVVGAFSLCVVFRCCVCIIFCFLLLWLEKITGASYMRSWAMCIFGWLLLELIWLFFQWHFMGIAGMPRRVPDYPDTFAYWNFMFLLLVLLFLFWCIIIFLYYFFGFFTGAYCEVS